MSAIPPINIFLFLLAPPVIWPTLSSVFPSQLIGKTICIILTLYVISAIIDFSRPSRVILGIQDSLDAIEESFNTIEHTCDTSKVHQIRTSLIDLQFRILTFHEQTIVASSPRGELRLFVTGHAIRAISFTKELEALGIRIKVTFSQDQEK
ncbi:hypothetical protein C0995_002466 [Termitomyces sp. Mi166|nr:hypothetical protein C0995_002466 [Termitomyces sp. Mi166\